MPEFCDLLDGDRGKTGAIHLRGLPLPAGRYHAVVHVWLRGPDGRFLISLRREEFHDLCDVWCFAVPALDPGGLTLQPEEVADARWAGLEEIRALDQAGLWVSTLRYCGALFQEDIPC